MSRLTLPIQTVLHAAGLHLSRWYPERLEPQRVLTVTSSLRIPTVLDVGANVGQFAHALIRAGFDGRIVSFEPLATEHARLVERARQFSNWTVAARCALGDLEGEEVMHRAGNSASSSLLTMRPEHVAAAPGSKNVGDEVVSVRRLDRCAEVVQGTTGPLFLKADTQGFELHVVRGASGLLPRVSGMLLEASLVPLYDGSPLLTDVLVATRKLGFSLYDLLPAFYSPTGQTLQVNVILTKTTA